MNDSSASPRSDSPPLDALGALLEDAPYVDDAGFSDRVLVALPPRRRSGAFTYAAIPAFAALGCTLAYALSGHSLPSHAAYLSLSVVMTWSFFAGALSLLLVASAALLAGEE